MNIRVSDDDVACDFGTQIPANRLFDPFDTLFFIDIKIATFDATFEDQKILTRRNTKIKIYKN